MAFQKGQVEVVVHVLAAPGAFLASDTAAKFCNPDDLVTFRLTATPHDGFAGPIYLRAVNYGSSEKIFSVNPIPAGGGESIATLQFSQVGDYPILFETDEALLPGEELQ